MMAAPMIRRLVCLLGVLVPIGCSDADKAASPAERPDDSGELELPDPERFAEDLVTWHAFDLVGSVGQVYLFGVNTDETLRIVMGVELEPEQLPSVGPAGSYTFTVDGSSLPYETRALVAVQVGSSLGGFSCSGDDLGEGRNTWLGQSGTAILEVAGDGSASTSLASVVILELGSLEEVLIASFTSPSVSVEACPPPG